MKCFDMKKKYKSPAYYSHIYFLLITERTQGAKYIFQQCLYENMKDVLAKFLAKMG